MKEIIWIGRGGQGAFTAAKLLGSAWTVNDENRYALAFPTFGPERRGAPIRAFTKLDDKIVLDRSQTEKADFIIVLDDTLYDSSFQTLLKPEGKILINSKHFSNSSNNVFLFDAEKIATEFRLPTVNTIMTGFLIGISKIISNDEFTKAITEYMPQKIQEKNIVAFLKAVELSNENSFNA